MFYVSWFGCVVLLIGMNVGVWRNERTWPTVLALAVVAAWLTCSMMIPFPLWELALLLLPIRVAVRWWDRPRLFLPLSLAAFAGVAATNLTYAGLEVRELLGRYPFESLADRLPDRPTEEPASVPPAVERLEAALTDEWPFARRTRPDALQSLHENTLRWFVARPNFGVARIAGGAYEYALTSGEGDRQPVPQPASRLTSGGLDPLAAITPAPSEPHRSLHESSVLDFVHPAGFGYVRDRDRVAGFQPHQFSKAPEPADGLQLRSLDLIGLVLHPEPVAYVSAALPRMDELRANPTRPLSPFEADSLKRLHAGEELVAAAADGGRVRLVGAIRNVRQCQGCHGGRRGELLGAFAYELVPR